MVLPRQLDTQLPATLPVVECDADRQGHGAVRGASRSRRSTASCSGCTSASNEPHAWWEEWTAVAAAGRARSRHRRGGRPPRDRRQLLSARRQLLLHRRAHAAPGRTETRHLPQEPAVLAGRTQAPLSRTSRSSTFRTKARHCPHTSSSRRLPSGRAPTVVLFDGLDNCKEMSVLFAGVELAFRGFHTLAIDGPGQGEALRLRNLPSRYDYEVPGTAAYEYVAARTGRRSRTRGDHGLQRGRLLRAARRGFRKALRRVRRLGPALRLPRRLAKALGGHAKSAAAIPNAISRSNWASAALSPRAIRCASARSAACSVIDSRRASGARRRPPRRQRPPRRSRSASSFAVAIAITHITWPAIETGTTTRSPAFAPSETSSS